MIEERDDDRAGPEHRTLRCSICTLDWPFLEDFRRCPSCGEPCTPFSHMKSMTVADAYRLKRNYDFENFYEEWDRVHDPERLRPDYQPPE